MRQRTVAAPAMLNSWKEIAAYFGRGVRTVQRWERELGLPIHRIGKGKRSPVYATITELRFWITTSEVARPNGRKTRALLIQAPANGTPLQDAHRLLASLRDLARTMAETSVRQHQQAELLQARLIQMRSRMK